jgi:hypothetical protein
MELEALHLKVRGQFALVGFEKGSRTTIDLTPTGQKQRGLLALLAYGSNRTLSRHWLRQHLWSDRGNEQAQASLRKALQSLKAIDCTPFELIVNTQTAIRLGDHIELDTSGSSALFEDLDIKDPMFNDWLSKLRHDIDGKIQMLDRGNMAIRHAETIRIVSNSVPGNDADFIFAQNLADTLSARLRSLGPVEIVHAGSDGKAQKGKGKDLLLIRMSSALLNQKWSAQISVYKGGWEPVFLLSDSFNRSSNFQSACDQNDVHEFAAKLVNRIILASGLEKKIVFIFRFKMR